ncbi:uncharacterized protein NDAI_0E02570 [Naumovozyma dairenensis CBS 421]|uniref:Uncharacterized protein n=1 Tax=Naumovozyma dairenensis (strain ATCC 10597 / BCRC 20456 / CBS 421 / NBRC 0211 / NRRL Y-12639) TaxID=1071378 RepID=G0WBF4_NAUDC|nr:hypothetical protein NDAI_0E02570 [Naumovozyma dairenensis CBS 421]CCD25074.1 hypothetical protein NDAI_0E02570 [Naumovozyma dairenensis CBS 421]
MSNPTRNTNGIKDQAVTKPESLNATTGEVLVKKSTGKSRVRKGQTEEQYQTQLYEYFELEEGPIRTEVDWMNNIKEPDDILSWEKFDLEVKHARLVLNGVCYRLYFQRRYKECLEFGTKLLDLYKPYNENHKNKLKKEIDELEYMQKQCLSKDFSSINLQK